MPSPAPFTHQDVQDWIDAGVRDYRQEDPYHLPRQVVALAVQAAVPEIELIRCTGQHVPPEDHCIRSAPGFRLLRYGNLFSQFQGHMVGLEIPQEMEKYLRESYAAMYCRSTDRHALCRALIQFPFEVKVERAAYEVIEPLEADWIDGLAACIGKHRAIFEQAHALGETSEQAADAARKYRVGPRL